MSEIATITANMPGIDHAPDILRAKFSREIAGQVRVVPSHHLAHAYTAWWPSGMDEAIVLWGALWSMFVMLGGTLALVARGRGGVGPSPGLRARLSRRESESCGSCSSM